MGKDHHTHNAQPPEFEPDEFYPFHELDPQGVRKHHSDLSHQNENEHIAEVPPKPMTQPDVDVQTPQPWVNTLLALLQTQNP